MMRHVVNVMRPTKSKGSLGQSQGEPETIIQNVPCSIETLSGNEQEAARQNGVTATYMVKLTGPMDIDEKCYLTLGSRQFNIAHVADTNLNGIDLVLLCAENK